MQTSRVHSFGICIRSRCIGLDGDPVRLAEFLADKITRRTNLETTLHARDLDLWEDYKLCEQNIEGSDGFGHDIFSIVFSDHDGYLWRRGLLFSPSARSVQHCVY